MKPQLDEPPYWAVPRCWEGECVAVLAGGGTLTQRDVDHVRDKCRVVAITRSYELAPWADWLFSCDIDRFWRSCLSAWGFAGTKIAVRPCGDRLAMPARWAALRQFAERGGKILRHTGLDYPSVPPKHHGISPDPRVVRGNNSLFQFLSVVHHTGVNTVLLLGADQRQGRWHSGYANVGEPNYAQTTLPNFASLAKPLELAGVAVINACPTSLIDCWPRVRIEEVI